MNKLFAVGLGACLAGCATVCTKEAAPNTLTECEKADGWELLWDGKTTKGWVGVKDGCKSFPKASWVIDNGVLTVYPVKGTEAKPWTKAPTKEVWAQAGGDIVTERKFKDFAFKVDFRLTPAANSGIKYFYNENENNGTTLEYQMLDKGHADWGKGRDGNRRVASLYDMMPANADKYLKPIGEWNTAEVISKGTHVEHWLNGVKVLEYERGGKAYMEAFKLSKYADTSYFNKNGKWGLAPTGRLLLQDHTDSTVSFRNIKVKEL